MINHPRLTLFTQYTCKRTDAVYPALSSMVPDLTRLQDFNPSSFEKGPTYCLLGEECEVKERS